MKVFISWSGAKSKAVAIALRKWIPDVLQNVKPWMSEADIDAGSRWSRAIEGELSETRFGIICLTRTNQNASWILFEAGAIAKTLKDTFVCPYLIDLKPAELTAGPLTQFQAKRSNKKETWELLLALNRSLSAEALSDESLVRAFERWWPDLEAVLRSLPAEDESDLEARSLEDKTDEILNLIRSLSRKQAEESRSEGQSDLAESALRAISAVIHAKAGSLESLIDPSKPYKILVRMIASESDFIPIEIKPRQQLFSTLTSIWAEMQDLAGAPEAFTYLWDWVLVRHGDRIPLLTGGGVIRFIPSHVVFGEDEKWEVLLLDEPLLWKSGRFGVLRGEPHNW
jgi:hypothetical protein